MQDIAELSRQLRELQRDCAAATVAAASVLTAQPSYSEDGPSTDGHTPISDLVEQLVAHLQACATTSLKLKGSCIVQKALMHSDVVYSPACE